MLIEVCVDSVDSARAAIQGGADRLELCGNLAVGGGITPSLGLLIAVLNLLRSPELSRPMSLMAMVRPRVGDFCYSEDEIEVMLQDIALFKKHGAHGVVVGALTPDGHVAVDALQRLAQAADSMEVCFHRAFDLTLDTERALRDIVELGLVDRILTSGAQEGKPRAIDCLDSLQELLTTSAAPSLKHLCLMPGSGVNPETVADVLRSLLPYGLAEIHMSGGTWFDGASQHRPGGFSMGTGHLASEWAIWKTDADVVRRVRKIVDKVTREYEQAPWPAD